MYVFWLNFKSFISEFFWRAGNNFKRFFNRMFLLILNFINAIRSILYKIIMLTITFTNIGFLIGIYLLYRNVKQCYTESISFFDTKYYGTMLLLIGIHIILIILSLIVEPKKDE